MTAAMPFATARGGAADELASRAACRSTSPRRSPGSRARLGGGQRQRRPRLRAEPARGLSASDARRPARVLRPVRPRALGALPLAGRCRSWRARRRDAGLELELEDVGVDRGAAGGVLPRVRLRPARRACPATYPHVLAFPLQMELMTEGRSPSRRSAWSTSRTDHPAPADRGERAARPARPRRRARPHPKGGPSRSSPRPRRRRAGRGSARARCCAAATAPRRRATGPAIDADPPPRPSGASPATSAAATRGVSGDRNPIHMHELTAKAFGFPRAIAHGMWTKARCLAALERRCRKRSRWRSRSGGRSVPAGHGRVHVWRRRRCHHFRRALARRRAAPRGNREAPLVSRAAPGPLWLPCASRG